MGWLADTERQWLAARERDAQIETHATEIYEALWAEVLARVNEAKATISRFAGLTTNGRQLAHVVSFPMDMSTNAVAPPRSIEIALHKTEHQIVVEGPGIEICFEIGICKDNAVCLKLDGDKISYERAAQQVLTAFLYPGLEPVSRTGLRSMPLPI